MKKVTKQLIGTLSFFICTQINADDTYLSLNYGFLTSSDNKVLQYQSVDELVGGSSSQLELRLGLFDSNLAQEDARIFLYVWNNNEKNNETGFGLGGEWIMRPFENKNFGFTIGAQAGLGYQDVSGKEINISTNVNKLSYILGNNNYVPTIAQFQDDTYVLDIALTLGSTYNISKNLSFDLGYVYKYDMYQVSYRNQDSSSILNQLSFRQDNHMIKTALIYKF